MNHVCYGYKFCGICTTYTTDCKELDMGTNRSTTEGLDVRIDRTDINYLKEGDRIRLARREGRVEVLYATADMDGHAVSGRYGLVNGSRAYLTLETAYINIKYDHVTGYTKAAPYPNDGLMANGPFDVYVTKDVAARIEEAKGAGLREAKRAELAEQLRKAEEAVAAVRKELEKL